ncbi:transposase [Streptomyces sp. NPDC054766]
MPLWSRAGRLEGCVGRSPTAAGCRHRRPGPRDAPAVARAGQWHIGDPPVLVVFDAGYDVTRLVFLLADLPVELLGRMRSDRVMHFRLRPSRRAGAGAQAPTTARPTTSPDCTWQGITQLEQRIAPPGRTGTESRRKA